MAGAGQVERLSEVMALLAETHARAAARDPSLTLEALADIFERLRREYRHGLRGGIQEQKRGSTQTLYGALRREYRRG